MNDPSAELLEAALNTLLVDYNSALNALNRYARNHDPSLIAELQLRLNANFLFASRAAHYLEEAFSPRASDSFASVAISAYAIGAFRWISNGVQLATEQSRTIMPIKELEVSRACANALDALNVTDEQVLACLDIAGTLMREQKINWLGQTPNVFVVPPSADDSPAVAMQYRLAISSEEAASLNNQLIDRLIESDLIVPCFTVSFAGVRFD